VRRGDEGINGSSGAIETLNAHENFPGLFPTCWIVGGEVHRRRLTVIRVTEAARATCISSRLSGASFPEPVRWWGPARL